MRFRPFVAIALTAFALVAVVSIPLSQPALAIAVDQDQLNDPRQEARARELFKRYRCMVCDNQSIDDSDASVAADLRALVREQVAEGQSDEQISTYLVARYGDVVLLEPPIKSSTLLLWGVPFALLLLGAGALLLSGLQRRKQLIADPVKNQVSREAQEKLAAWRKQD